MLTSDTNLIAGSMHYNYSSIVTRLTHIATYEEIIFCTVKVLLILYWTVVKLVWLKFDHDWTLKLSKIQYKNANYACT